MPVASASLLRPLAYPSSGYSSKYLSGSTSTSTWSYRTSSLDRIGTRTLPTASYSSLASYRGSASRPPRPRYESATSPVLESIHSRVSKYETRVSPVSKRTLESERSRSADCNGAATRFPPRDRSLTRDSWKSGSDTDSGYGTWGKSKPPGSDSPSDRPPSPPPAPKLSIAQRIAALESKLDDIRPHLRRKSDLYARGTSLDGYIPSSLNGDLPGDLPAPSLNGDPAEDRNGNKRPSVSEIRRHFDSNENLRRRDDDPPRRIDREPSSREPSSREPSSRELSSRELSSRELSSLSKGSEDFAPSRYRSSLANGTAREESSSSDSDVIENASTVSPRGKSKASRLERGGLVGLRNIGNTCFMNSVIQCLSNTKALTEYVINEEFVCDINSTTSGMKGVLIKSFATLIGDMWNGNSNEVLNPASFKNQVQRFAPRFMGYSQQDAQEFLRYLLEGLHEDVNRVTARPKPITTDISDSLADTQKAMESWKRYLRCDDSRIVDLFVGQLKSTLTCTVCGHSSVTFDPFWDLSLPIPSRTCSVRLQHCFDLFTKDEVLDGNEKPTCSSCKTRQKCTKSFTIQKFPQILVIHLKRFSPHERFRAKLSTTVEFPVNNLDMSSYAASSGKQCTYNLYGIANHSGTTYSGHYTAYCKHPYLNDWYEFNDARVSKVSRNSLVSGEAYLLFYELGGYSTRL